MAKIVLSNNISYDNDYFKQAFAEYLISNGMEVIHKNGGLAFEIKDKLCLIVRNDNIDLFEFDITKEHNHWRWIQNHAGIFKMDVYGFMFLMHAMRVVLIEDFISNAAKLSKQNATEARCLVNHIILKLKSAA